VLVHSHAEHGSEIEGNLDPPAKYYNSNDMSRTYNYLATIIGVICVYFIIHAFFFGAPRLVRNDIVQGVLIGFGLAFVSAQLYARTKAKKVNGWITMYGLGEPNNAVLLLGRVLVENDSDVATAYDLSKQIQLTPLSGWRSSQPVP
jgi:hypothetical protein